MAAASHQRSSAGVGIGGGPPWASQSARFHVLLVEDDGVTLKMVEQLLRKLDYKVSSAANGREALKALEVHQNTDQPIDLILTDILMPEVTGFDLINEVVHGVSFCSVPGGCLLWGDDGWMVQGFRARISRGPLNILRNLRCTGVALQQQDACSGMRGLYGALWAWSAGNRAPVLDGHICRGWGLN